MTSEKIREVALRHFARNGYEGASLAHIADEVKIKKQSIYNHFKGKDDLFFAVFQDVAVREMNFIQDYLKRSSEDSLEHMLYSFLIEYKERYEKEDDTKFFLRMSFFPPSHLEKEIVDYATQHIDHTELLLMPAFEQAASKGEIHPDVSVTRSATAFSAVLDSLFVEMLYGGSERSLKRLDASWFVYWRGIRNN